MKKYFLLPLLLLFIGCNNTPEIQDTKLDLYLTEHEAVFPSGTSAFDIINTLSFLGIELNKVIPITTTIKITDSAILNDFYKYEDIQTRDCVSIEVRYTTTEPKIHRYKLVFYLKYGDIISTDFNYLKNIDNPNKIQKDLIYRYSWQNSEHNIWNNDKIPFSLTIPYNETLKYPSES